ncbi:MAG: non-homologous end-joining DNA ligase [Pseudonocardiales bacterium]|nr:non-homologous end-joining DNA ligase [Pseudonocardiales bacterium]
MTTRTRTHSIEVPVTHPDRLVFPDDGITKGELVDYYRRIAAVMMAHLANRPLILQRYPRGISAEGFIQQDITTSAVPEWMGRAEVPKEGGGTVVHALANRPEALVWLANQNCLTPHVWLSRVSRPETPDRMVIDLDPAEEDFGAVRAAARAVRDVLTELGLVAFVQTTGSRGLHVLVPLSGRADFATVRGFARDVAELVVADDPASRTLATRKADRGHRVYLDVLRNGYAQTMVAPYAVRARPGAPVATPLAWDELGHRGMSARRYTLRNLPRRLARREDPWAELSAHARSLTTACRRLERWRA